MRTQTKTYAFRIDDDNNTEKKKAKGTKKCVIKRRLRFTDFYDEPFKHLRMKPY